MIYLKALPYLAALLFCWGLVEFGIHLERKDSQLALANINAQINNATRLASEQARKVEAERTVRIAQAEIIRAARETQTETITKVVNHEVIKYVQAPGIAHVTLPAEWVRIHNAAASGSDLPSDTQAPSKPDGAATDSQALVIVTDNYAACRKTADQLVSLQEWARAL